ncbi:DUF3891 family protein [Thalassobacillus pellis]|uniref:DUF3891 family protein n=1 Tax=Thalassobacillus pellis TaxID=748008 RepID=UPI001960F1CF|nr:DUF3891 family protein [Thalassobacillus pellis]MBM7552261.1 hypothetical protein [Thalassobacillus pellis]
MIVNQFDQHFLMFAQHDHALGSGVLVDNWKQDFLIRSKLREEADWAVAQHDRAWIPLDKRPIWNEKKDRPYSFIDYPLQEKLDAYTRGIDSIAKESSYAAMLCSLHYSSFFPADTKDSTIQAFLDHEKERREKLSEKLTIDVPKDLYDRHFRRLQFCDDLSLYICMQEPGVSKEKELSWFKNGFRQSFDFAPDGMMAHWLDSETVSVQPFPFERIFELNVPYRIVTKEAIAQKGLQKAWETADIKERKVTLVPGRK